MTDWGKRQTTVSFPYLNGQANQIATGKFDADGNAITRDATATEQIGGVNLSLSIGSSKSRSKTTQTSDRAAGSP